MDLANISDSLNVSPALYGRSLLYRRMITPLEKKPKRIKLKTRRVLNNDYGWRANAAVDIYNLLLIVMERQANISN